MQLLILAGLIFGASADIFSSMATMKSLVGAEKEIPSMINAYVEKEMERLNYLRKYASEVQRRNDNAMADGENSITHPINAFLLIKEMTTDWRKVVDVMMSNSADDFIRNVTHQRILKEFRYPAEEDLAGAAIGLLRLQDTYRLDTTDIANGKILHSKMRTVSLTANDCFEIGRAAYNDYDYYHTILWMQEAKDRVEKEDPPSASLEDILEFLAFALYKQGNLKRALQLTDELVRLAPDHPRARGNLKWYEDLLEDEGVRRVDMRRNIPQLSNPRHDGGLEHTERDIYEALCRHEVPVSTKALSRLYCYYKMDRPYLRLAPIKVEIMRLNPLAVLFHQIMSDEEARIIEMLAIPKLNRATVQNAMTGGLETASYRISKSAWLKPHEHEVVERFNKRLDMATNLEMETAEELQHHKVLATLKEADKLSGWRLNHEIPTTEHIYIRTWPTTLESDAAKSMAYRIQNYGVGGHYDPHFDCARKEEKNAFKELGTGNRIATILVYMTEPEIGGGTVFTEIKTSVACTKNAALFWYNLMRSGEVDMRSRHAACPVLTGVKWVTNKWIHERGQEWRRPCGLNQFDQERYVGDLGAPEPRNHWNIRSTP
ncbi:Prolyl 4-hydroxylase subunit alpha-1 [Toxocara canis]|uniref:procollagen-proline 4-dioxygenase n=1 Tax=Toxocara canis TaxID=6265 RepID=A0A0B2UX20_TOXCA|nr:Prolyl 4-hydroxylase subunit alpha-1 [Toxocara canis]